MASGFVQLSRSALLRCTNHFLLAVDEADSQFCSRCLVDSLAEERRFNEDKRPREEPKRKKRKRNKPQVVAVEEAEEEAPAVS